MQTFFAKLPLRYYLLGPFSWQDGVNVLYKVDKTHPTGTCAAIVTETVRDGKAHNGRYVVLLYC